MSYLLPRVTLRSTNAYAKNMETMTTGMMKRLMIGMIQVVISQNHRMRMKMMVFLMKMMVFLMMTTTRRAKQTGTLKTKTGRIVSK